MVLVMSFLDFCVCCSEVMKGLWAKKNGKMKQQAEPIEKQQKMRPKPTSDSKTGLIARSENKEHCNQVNINIFFLKCFNLQLLL